MKRLSLLVVACVLVLLVTGCTTSTHITKLPKPEEFSKDLSRLKAEYPDLTNYSSARRDWLATIFEMPEAEPLKEAWSEPHRTRLSAWMLFPIIPWIFHPCTVWKWEYDNKEITARIDHPIAFGYRPHVWKLKVEPTEQLLAPRLAAYGEPYGSGLGICRDVCLPGGGVRTDRR